MSSKERNIENPVFWFYLFLFKILPSARGSVFGGLDRVWVSVRSPVWSAVSPCLVRYFGSCFVCCFISCLIALLFCMPLPFHCVVWRPRPICCRGPRPIFICFRAYRFPLSPIALVSTAVSTVHVVCFSLLIASQIHSLIS